MQINIIGVIVIIIAVVILLTLAILDIPVTQTAIKYKALSMNQTTFNCHVNNSLYPCYSKNLTTFTCEVVKPLPFAFFAATSAKIVNFTNNSKIACIAINVSNGN